MSLWKNTLIHLESRLQTLIEGSATRLFPVRRPAHDLAALLVDAMQRNLQRNSEGISLAPNLFVLYTSPDQVPLLQSDLALIEGLSELLLEAGMTAGLQFAISPVVQFAPQPVLSVGEFHVEARHSQELISQTAAVSTIPAQKTDDLPAGAYLIINGVSLFPLSQSVINLGRWADNNLVIDDGRVSRHHAQLRAIRRRFVIFDLESTGGTWINGKRIHQHTLNPGDVISLAGYPLVYGQEIASPGDTQDYVVRESGQDR